MIMRLLLRTVTLLALSVWLSVLGNSPNEQLTNLFNDDAVVLSLENTTFIKRLSGSEKSSLVLFYLSWCGHCIRYAPKYTETAGKLSVWKDQITVSAINCAKEENTPICRDHGVVSYPTVKMLPPKIEETANNSIAIHHDIVHNEEHLIKFVEEKLHTWFTNLPLRSAIADKRISNSSKTTHPHVSHHNASDSSDVFYGDLVYALRYSLKQEVGGNSVLRKGKLQALKDYVAVLALFFPDVRLDVVNSIKKLSELLHDDLDSLSCEKWMEYLHKSEFLSVTQSKEKLIRCKGSEAKYRGYPCTLWTLFHTLVVHAAKSTSMSNGSIQVLGAMKAYIANFFGCYECAQNFAKMATEIDPLAESSKGSLNKESVLWLWNAHNRANKRLAGDDTEDPFYPKIQFPSPEQCKDCRTSKGIFDENKVFDYVLSVYSNVKQAESILYTAERMTYIVNHKPVAVYRTPPTGWAPRGMSYTDFCLSYVIYLSSVLIIGIVFYYIVLRNRIFLKVRPKSAQRSPNTQHYLDKPIY